MRKATLITITLLVIILAFFAYKNAVFQKQLQTLTGELELLKATVNVLAQPQTTYTQEHAVIFLIKSTPTNFFLVPVNRQIGAPINPAIALQTLLNGPLTHENLHEAVPHTTRLLGLSINQGLAIANFSSELVTDFNGGSLTESYLVEAIVSTLTEFPEINQVQILVDGEQIESIGGHVLISGPLTRAN